MRLLVIEDEHRIATTLKKGLEQEHYIVDLAFDGETGLDLACTEPYDVIILDLMLPKLDGVSVCKEIRATGIHTPIIILTAKDQIQDKVSGLQQGADDYLTKPFSFEELLARITALLRRPAQTRSTKLRVKNLSLDLNTFDVYRNNRPITLSAKEFSLLEFLMRNSNSILSKDQIIRNSWNYEATILPNTIEVYIRNLRNKIDKPFPDFEPLIHTIRGFGYKIG
ncbi:response regulator transcription factor [Candidatus Woesebacteria bacterium]|nr:response regulator transcription factor [Candidatus Woesebacteria bacterium]